MHLGHLKVRDDDVDCFFAALAQSFFSVFCDERLVTRVFEDGAKNDAIWFVVVDNENSRHDDEL